MAEQREAETIILLKKSGKPTVKLELFASEQWADPMAGPGVHRVRKGGIHGGRFVPEGQSGLVFYHLPDVLCMLGAEILGQANPLENQPAPHPLLHEGSRCRWKAPLPDPDLDALPHAVQCFAKSSPIRAYSGQWMICMSGGVGWVPCAEVTPLDHYGKPIPWPQEQEAGQCS
ncbi:MAG: hypothetical protein KKF77_03380 [Proteobacteria bacterium]|nr:hypothetical protein [Pseudomonadota bacterium]